MEEMNLLLTSAPGMVMGVAIVWRQRWLARRALLGSTPIKSRWLASRREEEAFRKLQGMFSPNQFFISAHMLLVDVIGRERSHLLPPKDREFAWRAHCDFVIVHADSLLIEKVVEVNGPFHLDRVQALRDRQKKRILERFQIQLEVQ